MVSFPEPLQGHREKKLMAHLFCIISRGSFSYDHCTYLLFLCLVWQLDFFLGMKERWGVLVLGGGGGNSCSLARATMSDKLALTRACTSDVRPISSLGEIKWGIIRCIETEGEEERRWWWCWQLKNEKNNELMGILMVKRRRIMSDQNFDVLY